MTQEEKAKAYNEALERANKELQACSSTDCDAAKQIFRFFPELKESKGERIRKALIDYFRHHKVGINIFYGIKGDDIIAWLEKQKPVETVNRDKIKQGILRGAAINLIAWIDYNAAEGNMCLSNMECKDIEEALVSGDWGKIYAYIKKKIEKQKPVAFNWSTDDKNKLLIIEQILNCAGLLINSHELTEIKNWLKSLKQRIGG